MLRKSLTNTIILIYYAESETSFFAKSNRIKITIFVMFYTRHQSAPLFHCYVHSFKVKNELTHVLYGIRTEKNCDFLRQIKLKSIDFKESKMITAHLQLDWYRGYMRRPSE